MPPPLNNAVWELVTDTLEKLRAESRANAIDIAVIKARVAIMSALFGGIAGVAGSVLGGVLVYIVTQK